VITPKLLIDFRANGCTDVPREAELSLCKTGQPDREALHSSYALTMLTE
jgi:hypothetical protein